MIDQVLKLLINSKYIYNNRFIFFLVKLLIAICVVIFFLFISKIIVWIIKRKIIAKIEGDNKEQLVTLNNIIGNIIYISLLLFSLNIGFGILDLDMDIIIGGLSMVFGLVMGDIMSNYISGILVITNPFYKIGDLITIGSYTGKIESVNYKHSIIKMLNKRRVLLPNNKISKNIVTTSVGEKYAFMKVPFQISYNDNLKEIKKELINKIKEMKPFVDMKRKDKVKIFIDSIGQNIPEVLIEPVSDTQEDNTSLSGSLTPATPKMIWKNTIALTIGCYLPRKKLSPKIAQNIKLEIFKLMQAKKISVPYFGKVLTIDKNDQNFLNSAAYLLKNYQST